MSSQVVRLDGLRSLAGGSLSGTYQAIGTAFTHQMRILKIVNNTTSDVILSFDGINDNDIVPAGGFVLYDGNTNKNLPDSRYIFQPNTTIYAKTGTTNAVFVIGLFGQGE